MKTYVLVGASHRCFGMFAVPVCESFKDVAIVKGIFDINRTRAEYISRNTKYYIPVYTDFDKMLEEVKPEVAIIATIDKCHHEYIIKALEYGCDVISEKPMTIDDCKCNEILDAEKRTGKKVTVTFNCRFMPLMARIKELLGEGAIGEITSVNYEYFLDTYHGADYFRRWHRRKENSGGLLVHKSTHHFDLVNWWLEDDAEMVYANGSLKFYGPTRLERDVRCSTCSYISGCEFAVKFQDDIYNNEMYFKAEKEDGYFRDRCVFSDEIDIEDTMSVMVKYSKGAILTYSLIAYSPYEGWEITINGKKGRLEASEYYSGQNVDDPMHHIKVFSRRGEMITYDLKKYEGCHGGGDERLREMLFRDNIPDPLGQAAGSCDGAKSLLIGVCANMSIKENKPFSVKKFISRSIYE